MNVYLTKIARSASSKVSEEVRDKVSCSNVEYILILILVSTASSKTPFTYLGTCICRPRPNSGV